MEEINSATTILDNHSSMHKANLGNMALVDTNSFTASMNDNLIPVNGNEADVESLKNVKNLEYVNMGSVNVKAANAGEMDVDSCKESEMDVERVNKDDVMDVDLVDHMDVDDNGRKGEEEDFVNDDLERVLGMCEEGGEKNDSCNLDKTEEALSNGNVENELDDLLKPEREKSEDIVKEAIEGLVTEKDPLHHELDSSQNKLNKLSVPDVDNTGSDEISNEINKELVSENLIDDLINFNDSSVLGRKDESINASSKENDDEKTANEDQDSYNRSTDESVGEDYVRERDKAVEKNGEAMDFDDNGSNEEAMDADATQKEVDRNSGDKNEEPEDIAHVEGNSANEQVDHANDKNKKPEPTLQNSADTVKENQNSVNEVREDLDTLLPELDQLFDGEKSAKIDDSSKETEDVPFGIIEATSIAPTEFENMESVEDEQPPPTILKFSELAQNILNENGKKPINVKTINEEKLDFNIKEEIEDYDQITIQENVDVKPNIDTVKVVIKKAKKKTPIFSYKKMKKKKEASS